MLPGPTFLRLSSVRDAVVLARPELDDWSGGAGVLRRVDGELRYVSPSGLRRAGRKQIAAPMTSGWEIGERIETAWYGGFLYDHYGHFILESLARLWPPDVEPDVPVVWIAAWTESFTPWMIEVLDLIGAPFDRRIVTAGSGALAVDELLMPDAGFEFGRFMHPWFARRLARHQRSGNDPGPHVWLSRVNRMPESGLDEELDLESAVSAAGWSILRPEDHTVREQVDVLAGAAHVAGIEGSAFHTLSLIRQFDAPVELFTRQNHPNFELVAGASGFEQVRHQLPGAVPRERSKTRGTDVQWSGVDVDATVALLDATCARHGHPPAGR